MKRKGLCLFSSVFCVLCLSFFIDRNGAFFFRQIFACACENECSLNIIITSIRARIRNDPSTYLRGHFSSSSANVVAVAFVLEKTIYY